jgi:tetratricopeptide (TPR) repeat protein
MRKMAISSPFFLLILLFLISCGLLDSRPKDQQGSPDRANALEPGARDSKALARRQENERLSQKKEEINRRLDAREFYSALEEIRREVNRGTPEKDLAPEYLLALNGVIVQGQFQLKEDNPGRAGLLFRAGLDSFPKDPDLASTVDLTSAELEAKIDFCADKLMEKGLIAYRVGNLNDAIEVWKQALAFHPQHQPCLNAIQTAYTQLKNLKSITDDD